MGISAAVGITVAVGVGSMLVEQNQMKQAQRGMPKNPHAPGTDPNGQYQIEQAQMAQRRAQGSAATLLNTSDGEMDKNESLAKAALYGS